MEIEVEVKAQIPSREWLESKLTEINGAKFLREYKQLNHYWNKPSKETLLALATKLSLMQKEEFVQLINNGEKPSMRTRCTYTKRAIDQKSSELIIKYTLGDDSSENGVRRIECTVPINIPITKLDDTLQLCGASVQAKWNREGRLWIVNDIEIQIGFSPGYGWIAEFEMRAKSTDEAHKFESVIRSFMNEIGVVELKQEKLERMFAYYNSNWIDYYLTQKVFDIDKVNPKVD